MRQTIELKETKNGFTERDLNSKAILNKDADMLLKYKIQKNRMANLTSSTAEIDKMKREFKELKDEISEIKNILLQLAAGKTWQ